MIIYSERINLHEMRITELDEYIRELEGAKNLETALYNKHIKELDIRISEAKKIRFEKAVDSI